MRFTLTELFLAFPAFFVGTFIATLFHPDNFACISYGFTHTQNETRRVVYAIESYAYPQPPDFSEATINNCLAGRMPPTHSLSAELSSWDIDRDFWGNPYQCVLGEATVHGQLPQINVYSMGEDGVSQTDGNDADDLRSWNSDGLDYYFRQIRDRRRMEYGIAGIILTPLVFVGMIAAVRAAKKTWGRLAHWRATTRPPQA